MKIGIFGDSFAARASPPAVEDQTFWSDVIGKVHDVENFAKAGTNLYWSYTLIKDNYYKFDTVILVVTGFGRLYTPNAKNTHIKHAFNLPQIEHLLETGKVPGVGEAFSEHDLTILKTLRDYKLYVEDDMQSALFHDMLLDRIKSLVPNVILIPSWGASLDSLKEVHHIDVNYKSLIDISKLDLDYCGISFNNIMFDKRFGHLSPSNNMILGQDLLSYIESDRKKPYTIDMSLYKTPHPTPKDTIINQYFVTRL
jgi:hypothetical protein